MTNTAATSTSTIWFVDCKIGYTQPFRHQPFRFLWWLDDVGHRVLSRPVHRRLLGWICDDLDRNLGASVPDRRTQ